MGLGAKSTPLPEPQPVPQPPARNDPQLLDVEKAAVKRAKKQDGISRHLLGGSSSSDGLSAKPKALIG